MVEELEDIMGEYPKGYGLVLAVLVEGHLYSQGGYPHDWKIYGNKVVVAGLDSNQGAELSDYDISYLRQWEKFARGYLKENEDASCNEAVYETEPREEYKNETNQN